MTEPATSLTGHIDAYLALRRGLGYRLEKNERHLRAYAAWLQAQGLDHITCDSAVAWARLPGDADPRWWAARLSPIRLFTAYLAAFEPATELIPADILTARRSRREPYVYTDDQIHALMAAAADSAHPLMGATYTTLIGLMAVTGMRVGEAIGLDDSDVDTTSGRIRIRHGKGDRSRIVPIHATTTTALESYRRTRNRHIPEPKSPAFFCSLAATRLIYANVQHEFARFTTAADIAPRTPRCRPRLHDLRHTFAIMTLIRWHHESADTAALLPVLATYLGHADPTSTYWYLQATPELLQTAARRMDPSKGEAR